MGKALERFVRRLESDSNLQTMLIAGFGFASIAAIVGVFLWHLPKF